MQTSRKKQHAGRALIYVAIVIAILVVSELLLRSELGSSPVYVVVSSSMVPTLEIGDLVMVQNIPYSDVHVGDVIIYARPSTTGATCTTEDIVHRVVAITPQGLITQGDDRRTNPTPDEPYYWPPITASCLRGRVVLALPYLGLISMAIPAPYNYLVVAVILLFVFLTELRSRDVDVHEGEERASAFIPRLQL